MSVPGSVRESELDQALARVQALAPEKDPALGTDQEWGLAQAPGLVQAQELELVPGLVPELVWGSG